MSTRYQAESEHDQLREISQRLITRTAVIEQRLVERLEAVREAYDLTPRALLSSHRQTRELLERGVAPSPTEFWSVTANPTAQSMVEAASQVADDEIAVFDEAVNRFRRSLTTYVMSSGDDCRGQAAADLQACVDKMARCRLDPGPINELGARWQARLRRAAIRSMFPKLLVVSSNQGEGLIAAAELHLLDQAPWAHDDRLLSAYELAHADVRQHIRTRLSEMSVIVPGRASRQLDTAG